MSVASDLLTNRTCRFITNSPPFLYRSTRSTQIDGNRCADGEAEERAASKPKDFQGFVQLAAD
jgi:hypothetical protein